MRKRIVYRKKRFLSQVRLIAIFASAAILVFYLVIKTRPVVTTFAESEAVWVATQVANDIVAGVFSTHAEADGEMILVSYDDSGRMTSVIPDSTYINALRTDITDMAMHKMVSVDRLTVRIPVGTLIGVDCLSGWGSIVSFPISYTATVKSDVTSTLEAVGMNQSIYRVLLHLDINLCVVSPGGRSSVGTRMSYPMAETVLLGQVPDNLTEVYGDDQSILGKIFDYGTSE